MLERAARLDWASVEPAIFGTLFERSLDPDKRSQLGAHYTSREDILLIVEPVLIAPLRRRWAVVREQAEELIARRDAASGGAQTRSRRTGTGAAVAWTSPARLLAIRVLDPACGSGNFLYVALKRLLDLEKEVSLFAIAARAAVSGCCRRCSRRQAVRDRDQHLRARTGVGGGVDRVHPVAARERVRDSTRQAPILRPLDNIRRMDAVLAADEEGRPVEPANGRRRTTSSAIRRSWGASGCGRQLGRSTT